jgi:hypothetical protein
MSVVTRDDAIRLIENGMRNWPHIPRISEDDLEDLRASLEGIVQGHRQSAIAELCEGLREASDILARGVHAHHLSPQGQLFLRCDASDLLTKLETLLSKHSPDAPGQHAGTRAIEPSDGDEA